MQLFYLSKPKHATKKQFTKTKFQGIVSVMLFILMIIIGCIFFQVFAFSSAELTADPKV